jgi:predicted  nucleic acid-binding Zn-ribbon protein
MSVSDSAQRNVPMVALSWGEVIDKITILEIKQQRLSAAEAIDNVRRELAALNKVVAGTAVPEGLSALKQALKAVNEKLWDIENRIRAKEAESAFDRQFIELARSVYVNNDERAKLKREINKLLNSELVEEKQYTSYAPSLSGV